jgi:hypothetical protein
MQADPRSNPALGPLAWQLSFGDGPREVRRIGICWVVLRTKQARVMLADAWWRNPTLRKKREGWGIRRSITRFIFGLYRSCLSFNPF